MPKGPSFPLPRFRTLPGSGHDDLVIDHLNAEVCLWLGIAAQNLNTESRYSKMGAAQSGGTKLLRMCCSGMAR